MTRGVAVASRLSLWFARTSPRSSSCVRAMNISLRAMSDFSYTKVIALLQPLRNWMARRAFAMCVNWSLRLPWVGCTSIQRRTKHYGSAPIGEPAVLGKRRASDLTLNRTRRGAGFTFCHIKGPENPHRRASPSRQKARAVRNSNNRSLCVRLTTI